MLGLLLAGPLLGVAWAASGQLRRRRELATDPPADAPPKLLGALPFTIPASASYRFASWLGAAATSLQQATPDTAMALLRLVTGGAFSLTVAAALGRRTLAITAMALLYILARSLGREQPARQSVQRGGEGALSKMADILVPILVTWLIGHATRAALRIESVLVATWFALVLWSCSHIHQTGKGLLRLLVPQVLLVAYFIVARQPVTAAGITLLASSQLLWSPLLQTPVGRTRYLRALQLPLAAAALLSAWTLGYGS